MGLGRVFQIAFMINGSISPNFSSSFSRSNQVMRQLSDTMRTTRSAQRQLDTSFNAGSMNISSYIGRMSELQRTMRQTQAQQERLSAAMSARQAAGNQFSEAKSGLFSAVSTAAVFATPFVGIMDTAVKFEATMSKVKAITGATGEDFQSLTAKARELGEKTQFSATQSAEAMTFLGMAGWKTNQILDGMPGLLNLAAAGGTDLARTADIISDDLTAFGLSADQSGRMADVFAKTITSTNTNVEMLGETMKYAAPVAHAFGASLEETSALAGLMANSGIKASQAGTALRSGFLRLAGPPKMASKAMEKLGMSMNDITAEQKEAAMALESLGISTNDISGPKKMSAILTELKTKTSDLGKEQKLAALKAIFGTEGATGWLAVLDAGPEKFSAMVTELENSNGAAEKMAKTMQDNAAGAITRLKSAAESVAISIGNVFLPALAGVADKLAGWAGGLSQVATEYPNVVQWVITAGAAMAGLVLYYKITKVASAAYNVVKTATLLLYEREAILASRARVATGLWGAVTRVVTIAQWAWNAALAANPVGIVLAGIIALVAAGYLLYQNWDTITAFMGNEWQYVCGIIGNEWDYAISSLWGAWESVCSAISNEWQYVCNAISNEWQYAINSLKGLCNAIVAFCAQLPNLIAYAVGFAIGWLVALPARAAAAFTQLAGVVREILSTLPGICINKGAAFVSAITNWAVASYNAVVMWMGNMVRTTGTWMSSLPGICISTGAAFLVSAENWLSSAYTMVTTWISTTVNQAGAWLQNLPSLCAESGAAFIAAAENWASGAYNAILNWISQIPSMVASQISGAGAAISNWWDGITASFKVGVSTGSGSEIAHNANGGIYGKGAFLTTFAEESPEAAIPLDGSSRAVGLWQQAGQMLGMNPATGKGSVSGSISATFAPQIHITGNVDTGAIQQIQQVLTDSLNDFDRKLQALQNQRARVDYV